MEIQTGLSTIYMSIKALTVLSASQKAVLLLMPHDQSCQSINLVNQTELTRRNGSSLIASFSPNQIAWAVWSAMASPVLG